METVPLFLLLFFLWRDTIKQMYGKEVGALAHFVMSDIHGEGIRFWKMLDTIGFSADDTLFVLGDVIDRGADGVELLRYVLDRPNIHMLMGNHEQMCVDALAPAATFLEQLRWNRNGNAATLQAIQAMQPEDKAVLLDDLAQLPDHMDITVGGKRFHLVHGFPGETTYSRLWCRPDYYTPNPFPDTTVIVGHTPVVVYASYEPIRDHMRILHAPGFIDIDCGCGHRHDTRRLACLRLEDMAEFYT